MKRRKEVLKARKEVVRVRRRKEVLKASKEGSVENKQGRKLQGNVVNTNIMVVFSGHC
jgi:hypothetical protein